MASSTSTLVSYGVLSNSNVLSASGFTDIGTTGTSSSTMSMSMSARSPVEIEMEDVRGPNPNRTRTSRKGHFRLVQQPPPPALPLPFLMNNTPSSDPGFREVVNRVREMKCAFGLNAVDHFCVQVKDYMNVLLDREKNRLEYQGSSPQKAGRPGVVKLMMKIAETEKLTRSTLHLSVYLYDRFSDFHVIPVPQLYLVAICCVIIAGKLEERDVETPKMKKLRSYLPPSSYFTYTLFTDLEKFILNYFKWSLLVPNAYTFLEFFLLFIIEGTEKQVGHFNSISFENNNNLNQSDLGFPSNSSSAMKLENYNQSLPNPQPSGFLQRQDEDESARSGTSTRNINTTRLFAIEVLDVLLHEEPNDRFPPSLVAASTLMFARRVFGFFEWSERLEFVTSYSRIQTLFCCDEYVKKVYESHNRCVCRESVPVSSSGSSSQSSNSLFHYNVV